MNFVRLVDQYKTVIKLKEEINCRMQNLSFESSRDMILWLNKDEYYRKMKNKDNQLMYLDVATNIWIREKQKLEAIGIQTDIFTGVSSLQELEWKYLYIMFSVLRVENHMSDQDCIDMIHELIELGVTGIALYQIIERETEQREKIIVNLSRYLKHLGEYLQATSLLMEATLKYTKNEEICLELADVFLSTNNINSAYECLDKIEKPSEEILMLKRDIKGLL